MRKISIFILIFIFSILNSQENMKIEKSLFRNNFKIIDFLDNPEQFKGEKLSKSLMITISREMIKYRPQSLRDCYNQHVTFSDPFSGSSSTISIFIPKNITLPNANMGDRVTVYWYCNDGNIIKGNVAALITR